MQTLPLIIHNACRSKVCSGTRQMVIKSCVLFYWSLFRLTQDAFVFLLLQFRMATMLIRNMQRILVSIPKELTCIVACEFIFILPGVKCFCTSSQLSSFTLQNKFKIFSHWLFVNTFYCQLIELFLFFLIQRLMHAHFPV